MNDIKGGGSRRYSESREKYARIGVDTDEAIRRLSDIPVSVHCWQGDDVCGFENYGALTGGIATTGNYFGRARTPDELFADLELALSLIPGKKRINLHASYAISDSPVGRDELEPVHFEKWLEFAEKRSLGIDFNPTFFSHEKAADGLTLSNPDEKIRQYWVRHAKACRKIAAYIGERTGSPCLHNIWIPDGYKDMPADRLTPRMRLKYSLDEIYADKYDERYIIDSLESKVFGIGAEAYTVGSSEFYISYASRREGVYPLLDNGHYHPTELISDKIPALLAFFKYLPLHVTRPMRWDSDHVVLFEDEIREIAKEIIRNGAEKRVLIGLDYFDASINRIAAWVIGTRNMQKALLNALLMPHGELAALQNRSEFTELLMTSEELKTYPLGDIWERYCEEQGVEPGKGWFDEIKRYETEVLTKRTV